MLNTKIQSFNYGSTEISNKPPKLAINRLKNKLDLKMSAAEILCLVRYFGLIIGDLLPKDNTDWKLYQYLRQIIDIILSPRIIYADTKILKNLIKDLFDLYNTLYGPLKPKFHFLLHYPRILLNNGPAINFWRMRYESSHCPLKSTAHTTSCMKNQ